LTGNWKPGGVTPSAPPYFKNKETKEGLMTPPPSFKELGNFGIEGEPSPTRAGF